MQGAAAEKSRWVQTAQRGKRRFRPQLTGGGRHGARKVAALLRVPIASLRRSILERPDAGGSASLSDPIRAVMAPLDD
jgi:hypothetical protein